MENHIFLPDRRLIDDLYLYETTYRAVDQAPVHPTRLLTFNLSGGPLILDGRAYHGPCLFCINREPPMVMVEKGEGELVMVRLRTGSFYRLFGLDGEEFGGRIIEAGHNEFPPMANIGRALADSPPDIGSRKRVLDRMFLDLLPEAPPDGLLNKFRFIAYWTRGGTSVAEAARRLGVSVRTLERDCKLRSGYSPKALLRRFRFAYLDWSHQESGASSGPIKFDRFGEDMPYSDQAHFLREYRDLSGLNPTELFEADHWRRQVSVCYHSRDDVAICEYVETIFDRLKDSALDEEYEANGRYFPYGEDTAKELGLEDRYSADGRLARFRLP